MRKWRHSKWCGGSRAQEPMCVCGHPLCLHREVARMTVMHRTEACRSKDCEGQCEGWECEGWEQEQKQ